MRYFVCLMRGKNFANQRPPLPLLIMMTLKDHFFENPRSNTLRDFKMSYLTPMHRVLYHIVVNVLTPTSGHETNVIHIGLHPFYGLLRGIQIKLGTFMIKYMML